MARTREQIQADILELNKDIAAVRASLVNAANILVPENFPPDTDLTSLQTALDEIKVPDDFKMDLAQTTEADLPNIENVVKSHNTKLQEAKKTLDEFNKKMIAIRKAAADYATRKAPISDIITRLYDAKEQARRSHKSLPTSSTNPLTNELIQKAEEEIKRMEEGLNYLINTTQDLSPNDANKIANRLISTINTAVAKASESYYKDLASTITPDDAEKKYQELIKKHSDNVTPATTLLNRQKDFTGNSTLESLFNALKTAQANLDHFIREIVDLKADPNFNFNKSDIREGFLTTPYPEGLRLLTEQQAAYNNLDAAVKKAEAVKEKAEIDRLKLGIEDKLKKARENCRAYFNNQATPPIRGDNSIRRDASVETAYKEFVKLRKELHAKDNAVKNGILNPFDLAQLKKYDQDITDLIEKLNPAIDATAKAYDTAEAFVKSKKDLEAKINSAFDSSATKQILAELQKMGATISPTLAAHDTAIRDARDKLNANKTDIKAAKNQAELDALALQITANISDLNDAVKKAGVDVYAGRLKNMDAQFSLHKEHIGRIVNGVRLIVGQQAKKGEYNDRITEINNLIADLELLKQWDKENKRTKDKDIDMGLEQLHAALYMLENPGKGIAHNAQYSEAFTIDANDKTGAPKGEKAIVAEARTHEESLLKKAGYDSQQASMSIGSLSSGSASSTAGSKYITEKFFGALKKGDKLSCSADIFVVEKGAKKSDHAIAATSHFSSSTATVTTIRLTQHKEENREVMWNTGLPTLLPSLTDRQLAMKVVLSHIEKDIYRQLLEKLAILDKTTPGAAADKANKILKQIMRGDAPTEFKDLHIKPSPLFINGNLPDNYSEAIMLASDYLGVACTDSRTGPNCDIKTKVEGARRASYAFDVRDNPERYFENGTKPFFAIKAADTKKLIDEAHIQLRTKP